VSAHAREQQSPEAQDKIVGWILRREVVWDEPTPSRPNGVYYVHIPATHEELRVIEAAVDECLDRGEGLLSHIVSSGTEFLLRWRQRTHPKKAIPGARRGRPRNERLHEFMTEWNISRSTAYRLILEAKNERDNSRE